MLPTSSNVEDYYDTIFQKKNKNLDMCTHLKTTKLRTILVFSDDKWTNKCQILSYLFYNLFIEINYAI